jgi:hypothetical protein
MSYPPIEHPPDVIRPVPGTGVALIERGPGDGSLQEESAMKRTLTLAGFLIAGTAALSLGCQRKETTTTTETTTTSEVPTATGTPEPMTETTTTTSTMDAPTPVP